MPRPRKSEEDRRKPTGSVRFTDPEREAIKRLAKQRKVTVSDVIRDAVLPQLDLQQPPE